MADPTLQTFCCIESNRSRPGADSLLQFRKGPYSWVCLVFAVGGILGATYQILPRRTLPLNGRMRGERNSNLRGRYIIVWLATADLLASIAVLVRSISWLIGPDLEGESGASFNTLFCAVSNAWIQYFYTATCLWTLFYAVDMYKVVHSMAGDPRLYHAIAWTLPALLSLTGLSILYTPDLSCHSISANPFARVLPNYVFTYAPIIAVMLVNPWLYYMTSKKAQQVVVSVSGRFTANERSHIRSLKLKFLCINLVFYLCWIPNILNAFLLWILWADVPRNFVLFDWYLMAILNPLQACFNAFVYRKWGDKKTVVVFPWRKFCRLEVARDIEEERYLLGSNSSPISANNGVGVEDDSYKSAASSHSHASYGASGGSGGS